MTKEQANAMYDSGWWKNKTPQENVRFQLFEPLLCMPFRDFHGAVEKALNRPVWTHEFGLNYEGLKREFLGDAHAPSLQEIIEMIPEAKRIIVVVD